MHQLWEKLSNFIYNLFMMIEGKGKAYSKSKCRTITTNFSSNLSKSKPINTDIKDFESHYFVPTSNRSSKIPNLSLPSNKSVGITPDFAEFVTPKSNIKPDIATSSSNLQLSSKLSMMKIVKMFNIFKIPFNTPNKSQKNNQDLISVTSSNKLRKSTSPFQKEFNAVSSVIMNESSSKTLNVSTVDKQLLPFQSRNISAKLNSNTAVPIIVDDKEKILFSPVKKKSLSTSKLKLKSNCSKNRNNSLIVSQNDQKCVASNLLLKCSPIITMHALINSRKSSVKHETISTTNSLNYNCLIKELAEKQVSLKKINCNSLTKIKREQTENNKGRECINQKKPTAKERQCKSSIHKKNFNFFISENLKFIKLIGVGAFSSVRLYEELIKKGEIGSLKVNGDSNLIAVKVYDKKALGDKYKANSITNEVSIVRSLNSNLIIKLYKYQETVNQVCFKY